MRYTLESLDKVYTERCFLFPEDAQNILRVILSKDQTNSGKVGN